MRDLLRMFTVKEIVLGCAELITGIVSFGALFAGLFFIIGW